MAADLDIKVGKAKQQLAVVRKMVRQLCRMPFSFWAIN
jgi:hypothetical protein